MAHNIEFEDRIKKYVTIAFKIFFGILAGIAFALLFGYVIMWLWNWLMPEIFGLKTIGYWQAVGILVLAKMLFGGLGGHHSDKKGKKSRRRHRAKGRMTCRKDFDKWKHYDQYWEEEGETAFDNYLERIQKRNTLQNDTTSEL